MLQPTQIEALLSPYLPKIGEWPDLSEKLSTYLELLLKWNARTNLTAIRSEMEIVQRHFGESFFAALHIEPSQIGPTNSLLDYGSGAGFPGIPIQLLWPALHVTLAESQGKKAAFLHEVTRALELPTEIWPHRVETMPPTRTFDIVTVRAVDKMGAALEEAARRATRQLLILTTAPIPRRGCETKPLPTIPGFDCTTTPIPRSDTGILLSASRQIVPRGTI